MFDCFISNNSVFIAFCFSAPAQGWGGWLLIPLHLHINNALPHKIIFVYARFFIVEIVNEYRITGLVRALDSSDFNAHLPAVALRRNVVAILLNYIIGLYFCACRPVKSAVFEPVNLDPSRQTTSVPPFCYQSFCYFLQQGFTVKNFDVERDYFQQWAFRVFLIKSDKVSISQYFIPKVMSFPRLRPSKTSFANTC